MKRWIRWQGLLAFVVVIVLVAVFWFFFVDNIVKNNIEKYGSKAVGAKVEVKEADLSLIPFGL
jgi:competence protein ComGC